MIANSIVVPCPNAECGCDIKKIARGDLKLHLEKFCTGRTVSCKYAKYGCEWSGQMLRLEEHYKECAFSKEIVVKALEKLELNISELTRENEQLRQEKANYESKIKELEEKNSLLNGGNNMPIHHSLTAMNGDVSLTNSGRDTMSTPSPTAPVESMQQIHDSSSLPPWAQSSYYSSYNPSYSGTTSFYNSAGVSTAFPPPSSGVPSMSGGNPLFSSMLSSVSSSIYNPPLQPPPFMTSSSYMSSSSNVFGSMNPGMSSSSNGNGSINAIHTVECGICKKTNFSGVLYQCTSCINFSICSACYSTLQITQTHDRSHGFFPLRKARGKISGVTWLRLATCGSSVSLPLADNDYQDLEFYVNERTGASKYCSQ